MEAEVNQTSFDGAGRGRLLRVLGVGFGLAVIVGNTIGAGILRTPGEVASRLPEAWVFLAVWLGGGIYALFGAVSIAELGTMLPKSGGQYVFVRHALGDYAGFIVGWSDWLSTCGTAAAVSIVIGEYSSVLFEPLRAHSVDIALAVVAAFALLQWRGVVWGSSIQNVTSLLKALAFLVLVTACFVLRGSSPGPTAPVGLRGMETSMLFGVILALQAVIYTYDGWTGVIYFSEEVRDQERSIPRAMIGGVFSVIGIYLLVNVALVYVLPMSEIAGRDLAIGAAAERIFGDNGDTIIRTLTILSMLSGINAYHLMATRVLYAMSRDGLFSQRAVEVNDGGTPSMALFISAAIAGLFILSGTFEKVIAVLAFFFVANYTLSFISVFVLRRREPERNRPYRAWGFPWTTGAALLISAAFLAGAIASDTRNSIHALLLLGASYPAFRLIRRFSAAR